MLMIAYRRQLKFRGLSGVVGKQPLLSPIYNAGGVPGSRAGKARGICRDPRLVDECRVCEIL